MSTETELLLEQVTEQVRNRLRSQRLTSVPSVTGTWQDPAELRMCLAAGAQRLGTLDGHEAGPIPQNLASIIDHTLLKPTATRKDLEKLCREARDYKFASVCVNTTWIDLAVKLLKGSTVMPICVVGFPLGAASTAAKACETRDAVRRGAAEIDMVINIGALKGRDYDQVLQDIREVVAAARGRPVKVILETAMLNREEKIAGSALSKAAGAAFVKTSTGFGGGGATVEDIRLIRSVVGPAMGIKASGGVGSARAAKNMLQAGATRIGASASVAIVTESMAGRG